MMIFPVFVALCILISHSSANIVSDYCVADLSLPYGPAGYACKDPKRVTVDDFVFVNLTDPTNTANLFKSAGKPINTAKFPGLNGLGVSVEPSTMDIDGVISFHTHRVSEVLLVVQGTPVAGFIDSTNKAYYKKLNEGDLMIFPESLMHFLVNVGSTRVVTYSTFASENPGTQLIGKSLYGSNLKSEIVEKVASLDHEQVQKLRKLYGGTT